MNSKIKDSFLYRNSLTITFLSLALITIIAQILTGLRQYNDFLSEHHQDTVGVLQYLTSGHFIEATFENWESEFFQMALFVWLTVFLRQKVLLNQKHYTVRQKLTGNQKNIPTFLGLFTREE